MRRAPGRMITRPVGTAIGCLGVHLVYPWLPGLTGVFAFALAMISLMYCCTPGSWVHPIFSTSFALALATLTVKEGQAIQLRLFYLLLAVALVLVVNRFLVPTRKATQFRHNLRTLCRLQASYWEMPLPAEAYDLVLSTYSLHHASPSEKLTLYRRIYETLAKGGRFLYGDYVLSDSAQEEEARREGERIRKAHGLRSLREVHVDIPLSMETERDLLRRAGFPRVTTAWEGVNAAIFVADKAAL